MEEFLTFNAAGQVVTGATITRISAEASFLAYTDFTNQKHPSYQPPDITVNGITFNYVERFTGYNGFFPWGTGWERFGLVYRASHAPDSYLFAFRGTWSSDDIISDLDSMGVEKFHPYHNPGNFPDPVHVGSGFNQIYTQKSSESITEPMQTQLFKIIDSLKPAPRTVYVTGHSLGCPLASFFMLDLAVSRPGKNQYNINFASPRAGTGSWMSAYDNAYKLRDKTVRIYNTSDYVPPTPPGIWPFDFHHVGQPFRVTFYPTDWTLKWILACHSLENYKYVIDRAVVNNPQIWTGTFNWDSSIVMKSVDPFARPSTAEFEHILKADIENLNQRFSC